MDLRDRTRELKEGRMEKKKQESEHGDFGLIRVTCNKLILNKTENTRVDSLRFVWIMKNE